LLAPLLPAGEPVERLLRKAQYFVPGGAPSPDFREVHRADRRAAEEFYRERWRHDEVVRSAHGVNCTGSCSWQVYVKDGIITWETQQTDYPSTGPDSPEYEPRGCPRGASFSWYTYSPSRVRYPYVRFRGLFSFQPDVAAIAHAPLIYQIHATAAWVILAVWPFSRLVHAWSYPLWYLWRPYIVYRRRRPAKPAEPGTADHRWRKIGAPG
jgi:nitrate reductase alpha subunit